MNPANPILSPDGKNVVHGFGDLYLNQQPLLLRGQQLRGTYPGWLTLFAVAFLDRPDDPNGNRISVYRGPDVDPSMLFGVRFNKAAYGGGRWIGTNTEQQTTYVSSPGGVVDTYPDTYSPAISPDGSAWACLTNNNETNHGVMVNGEIVAVGEIDDPLSIINGAVVFSIYEVPSQGGPKVPQTYGFVNGRIEKLGATWDRYEKDPVAVQTPGSIWLISHDDTRTLIRPLGEKVGYERSSSDTPHAMWVQGEEKLRVVGNSLTSLFDESIDLSSPRIDLSKKPEESPPPKLYLMPFGTVIEDTFPYVFGTPNVWPRVGNPGTPDNMDLVWDSLQRGVCWVKYASTTFIEWHRVTADMIHHHEDRSDGTDTIYHFRDDRWIQRRWAIGDVIDCRKNNQRFVTFNGGRTYGSEPWAYTNTLIAGFYDYPCGGDMGVDDVFVVECNNTWLRPGRPGLLERFWFSKRWGAWRFQDWSVNGPKPTFAPPDYPQAVPGLRDFQWSRLGGRRVMPVPPVRPWPTEEEPEVPAPKPYDEQFYLNTAPPMKDDDPKGACNQAIADYRVMGREPDHQYPIWMTRTEWDYQDGLALQASWKKHRNEMRQMLNPAGDKLPLFP